MRSWKTAVLLATVALAARAPARADKPESGDEKPPHHEHHGDLTDEQHAKIKEIFAASRATMKARGEEMRVAVEKLRWQVDAKASDKDLEATLDAIDKARAALRDEREKTEKKIAAVLTPQQRAGFFLHMQGGHALPGFGPETRGDGPESEGMGRRGPPDGKHWGGRDRADSGDEDKKDDDGPGDDDGGGPP
jgi:Spy/CpxP family protein refolding chaperone